MSWLFQWDIDAFRYIHLTLRREWFDPVMLCVTSAGLGYLQAGPLLAKVVIAWKKGFATWLILGLTLAPAAMLEREPFSALLAGLLLIPLALLPTSVCRAALISLVCAGLLRLAIVPVIKRPRPSNLPFSDPLEPLFGSSSFPSGHVTTSFAIVSVLVWVYFGSNRSWIANLAVCSGLLIAFSRIYVGVHFPLDVISGAIVGTLVGSVVFALFEKKGAFELSPEGDFAILKGSP